MNRINLRAVVVVFLATLCGCEESPFMSKQEAIDLINEVNTSRDPFHYITDVAAIIHNDVYYFERLDSIPRRLTNTPSLEKTNVKLSWDKSQIVYIDAEGYPVIIKSSDGAHIKTLTDYQYSQQVDWAKDRNTLYMINGNTVYGYGEAMTIPQPDTDYPFPYDDVVSFSMNAIGDHAYYVDYYNGTYPLLTYHSESEGVTEQWQNFDGELYEYVDFYDNKGGFMLGDTDYYSGGMDKIVCIKDYNFWSAYEWDYETMMTPEFNGDLEILVYGTREEQPYHIKAVYLGTELYEAHGLYDRLTKDFITYTSATPIYLDWNH